MSKISKIAVPGVAEPYDIEAYKALSIPFGQVDSTSTSTAFTAQIEGITSLYDGVCVYLKNGVVTSESGFTLNINGLGAKPVYQTLAAATRSTTVFNINYTMLFVYNSSRVSGGCWDIFYGYNSDTNTIAYNVRVGATPPTTSNKLVKYGIAFTKTDGHLLSSNTTGTTATSKALTAIEFDPFAPMYYYPTTAVAANGIPSASYLYKQYSTVDLRYAFNAGSTLVVGSPVYVRCVPQTDGTVKLDGNNCIVQTLSATDDNKVYIYLGYAYDTAKIFLDLKHPVYCIRDGRREFWHGDKHYWTDIINPPSDYIPSAHNHVWSDITNPPADYTPSSHEHSQYAPLASPSFSGIPTAPTPTANDSSSQIANTGWVKNRIDGLGTVFNLKGTKANAASLPTSNNTIGDVWYVTAESVGYIWLKDSTNVERWEKFGEPISLPATYTPSAHSHAWSEITSTPTTYTPSSHTHIWADISNPPSSYTPSAHTHDNLAPINSPQFTGTPTAPSPNSDNNSTAIANTAWVNAAISSALAATDFITEEDLPATYTPSAHTHTWANISNPPASYTPSSHSHAWNQITSPPASYTPSSHSHTWSQITNTPANYTPSNHSHNWSEITNTPASYTPSTHTHSEYALINSPQFTGTPTAPDIDVEETPTYSQIATENWVNQKVITVLTITEEEIDRDIVYTYEPNLSLAELTELALNNRLQLIYENAIYPFVRYYAWRPGMFGNLHHVFEFSRIQYADINDLAPDVGVYRIDFEYDTTTSLFLAPELTELGFLTTNWHDQYTVQDTTLIIGDMPVEENNVSPIPEPDGER